MNQRQTPISFTGFHLKYFALFTMTLDHIGAVLLTPDSTGYTLFRAIGRMAFPIFCFLLVEGFFHTRSHMNYLKRLFVFALISELPFDMAFYQFPVNREPSSLFCHQNIFFTLALGFFAMYMAERFLRTAPFFAFLSVIGSIFLAQILRFDYGGLGIIIILLFYGYRRFYSHLSRLSAYTLALIPFLLLGDWKQFFVLFTLPLFLLYHGQRGNMAPGGRRVPGGKYFFYWYYPCHLLFLGIIYFTITYAA